ncbi:TonB family protein [Dyadobacter sp. BE34]|uniref:TonB family protein n=1 Tax=Dyadobacter fermentans TaxID=94254 RepID=A0ABU1QV63_9BACT|nr:MULTISPECIES: energy transducer TonB [Dyadobacter]MDR6805046.1 TonB family protein [Dyadobacter fermentans]MDR7043195.1 TonB family protein [Dyadobacter sp. BE242]MDR7197507.1 TonB family protein [Dyadobacter sp. BE34]MDR7215060.1 TonB family protein [Dyadobacter sp. BE31]MDR7262595.1 TonB family protein [Dyadobacter sp. BE32]
MKHFCFSTTFLVLTACTVTCASAQVRKAALPADTGVLSAGQPIVPHETPPKTDLPSSEKVFGGVEQQPEYPGGTKAMYKFINANLHIPAEAKEAGISGKVFTSFYIEVTGEITKVTVLKGLGFGCDEEAVRMIESMPKWKPGKVYSKPVRVKYNLPVSFDTR